LFGAFIIGDEILVGKREDKHLSFLIAALAKRGLRLSWAQYLGDDPARLTEALRHSFASSGVVFSFGGIGATPDDHTRQCAAAALGVTLKLHPEAEREIRARFGAEVTPQRLQMGEFPAGAATIPNPVNRIPGFSLHDHHFVPGFPQMAWPMIEWVLDAKYKELFNRDEWTESSILVFEAGESQLIPAMTAVEAGFKGIKVFSLPSMGADGSRNHVELGVRGAPAQVEPAMQELRRLVRAAGFPYK
jgi:molybdopterin-biosynthesis enzyme MoeA-like protein